MKLFVVIPAYNEEKNIGKVLQEVKKYTNNIIVIDDGSKDRTYELAKKEEVMTLKHKINLGKGAALKTGCEAALKLGAEMIVIMDADRQHSPADIPRFIEKLKNENLDIVFGSRKIGKEMPLIMFLGNKFLSVNTKFLFNIFINDTQSGFRAFTAKSYPKIYWNSRDYAAETEMIVKVGKYNLKYGEITIDTIYNDRYKGTTILDGLKIFFNMLIWKFL